MATFFVRSPALHQIHLTQHRMARANVLVEARSFEGESLAHCLFTLPCGPIQPQLDLVTLGRI
ncbi:MAG: hypothetical protein JO020_32570 [Chloroflexi bacterium]|nr:hypothetical protein [Chloroflexota bacterium]MBV9898915.1 hypothetical protein [Chloroflexota bacterium]